MKKILSVLALFAITLSPQAFAGDHAAKDAMVKPAEAATTVVAFHADWCGGCKILEPKMKEVMKNLDADTKEKLAFVEFDFTDDATSAATKELAVEQNLASVYPEGKPSTGVLKIVDTATGTVIGKIHYKMSNEEITGALKAAVARS